MNLVALLIGPAVIQFSYGDDANAGVRVVVALVASGVVVGAVYVSKRRGIAMGDTGAVPEDEAERSAKPGDPVAAS
jgi:K(+)-stimulated pyrophosphate-energized sodium pump